MLTSHTVCHADFLLQIRGLQAQAKMTHYTIFTANIYTIIQLFSQPVVFCIIFTCYIVVSLQVLNL